MRKIPFIALIALFFLQCSPPKEFTIKIMSYNVRHGESMTMTPALEKQAEIINNTGAQWIGLQEIDNQCNRSGNIDEAQKYGELTNSSEYFGKFMDFDGGQYGMATLSKLIVKNSEAVQLPEGAEPRVAILQIVELATGVDVAMVNVHFDWTNEDLRVPQVKTLLKRLNEVDLPTIILGDYNAEPDSPTLVELKNAGFSPIQKGDNNLTWPADNPEVEIDHVFYRGNDYFQFAPIGIHVLEEKEASDHRPVVAELKLISK